MDQLLEEIKRRAGQVQQQVQAIDPRQKALNLLQQTGLVPVEFLKGYIRPYEERGKTLNPAGQIGETLSQYQEASMTSGAPPFMIGGAIAGVPKIASKLIKPVAKVVSKLPLYIPRVVKPLAEEARKYKSAEEFVKAVGNRPYISGGGVKGLRWFYKKDGVPIEVPEYMGKILDKENFSFLPSSKVTKTSNNLYHTTSAENLDSIRKSGLTTGNAPRFEGVSSLNKISFSANEKGASYYGKQGDVMIRTKTGYKPTDLDYDLLAGGEGYYRTGKNIPPEMLEIKINGKWRPLTQATGGVKK